MTESLHRLIEAKKAHKADYDNVMKNHLRCCDPAVYVELKSAEADFDSALNELIDARVADALKEPRHAQ